jgi:hypothetical protein
MTSLLGSGEFQEVLPPPYAGDNIVIANRHPGADGVPNNTTARAVTPD